MPDMPFAAVAEIGLQRNGTYSTVFLIFGASFADSDNGGFFAVMSDFATAHPPFPLRLSLVFHLSPH